MLEERPLFRVLRRQEEVGHGESVGADEEEDHVRLVHLLVLGRRLVAEPVHDGLFSRVEVLSFKVFKFLRF